MTEVETIYFTVQQKGQNASVYEQHQGQSADASVGLQSDCLIPFELGQIEYEELECRVSDNNNNRRHNAKYLCIESIFS